MRFWRPQFFLLLLLLLQAGAHAADPTRPPAAWLNALPGDALPEDAAVGMRLQSVLLPQHGKPVAIIGGKTLRLGERYGEDTLVQIRETHVVLRGAEGETRLYLTPQVEKRMLKIKAGQPGQKKEVP